MSWSSALDFGEKRGVVAVVGVLWDGVLPVFEVVVRASSDFDVVVRASSVFDVVAVVVTIMGVVVVEVLIVHTVCDIDPGES